MSTMEVRGEVSYLKSSHKMIVGLVLGLAALNWGLVGLLGVNLVEVVFGTGTVLTKSVYVLIGLVGIYKLYHITMGKGK